MKPTLSACAVNAAAIVTCRSSSLVCPPDAAVNALRKSGCQVITSRISSPTSTCGIIASQRLRRSVKLGGSAIAESFSACRRPSSPMLWNRKSKICQRMAFSAPPSIGLQRLFWIATCAVGAVDLWRTYP